MAKGQKRSNRETRKPKQVKPQAQAAARSFLETASQGGSPAGAKRPAPRP